MYATCISDVCKMSSKSTFGNTKSAKTIEKPMVFLIILSMSALAEYERLATDDECKRSAEEAVAHKSSDVLPGQIYLRCM